MAEKEGIHQRIWQADDFDSRYKMGTGDLPERCLRKVFAPEDLPASDGPTVGAEARGKLADSPWRGPLPHGADEDDDGVTLFLQPSRSQQKLSLRHCGSGSCRGVPRGFRG